MQSVHAEVVDLLTPHHRTTQRDVFGQHDTLDLARLGALGHTFEVGLDQAIEWQQVEAKVLEGVHRQHLLPHYHPHVQVKHEEADLTPAHDVSGGCQY